MQLDVIGSWRAQLQHQRQTCYPEAQRFYSALGRLLNVAIGCICRHSSYLADHHYFTTILWTDVAETLDQQLLKVDPLAFFATLNVILSV